MFDMCLVNKSIKIFLKNEENNRYDTMRDEFALHNEILTNQSASDYVSIR